MAHDGSHAESEVGLAGEVTIRVVAVKPNSPGAGAGLLPGDVLLELGGNRLATYEDLGSSMASYEPGDTVSLVVEREGVVEESSLEFGARPGGGISIGVELAVEVAAYGEEEASEGTVRCWNWIEETYGIESALADFELDMVEDYERIRACVGRDTRRMSTEDAVRYCDNVFQIHCSALDLLAEIGEARAEACEAHLQEDLGRDPRLDEQWTKCGRGRIFDLYSEQGKTSDAETCRAIYDACGQAASTGPPVGDVPWRGSLGPRAFSGLAEESSGLATAGF